MRNEYCPSTSEEKKNIYVEIAPKKIAWERDRQNEKYRVREWASDSTVKWEERIERMEN